jgi:hypothetical protein
MNQFLSTVPKGVRVAGGILVFLGALAGLIAGGIHGMRPGHMEGLEILVGLGMGLAAGCVFAIWILCLGYVYADARRRAMPGALWVLVAVLVPNLLGFLLYFVLRRPIASPCPKCGRAVAPDQRFCSWCGYELNVWPPSGPVQPQVGV